MRYLLDTSIIIDFIRHKESVKRFITDHMEEEIVTSCICEVEIMTGIYLSKTLNLRDRKKSVKEIFDSFYDIIPFDSACAEVAGQIKAALSKKGQLIDDLDILIAATSIVNNSVLVTTNKKHFERIKNFSLQTLFLM